MKYNNMSEYIGNTPLINISSFFDSPAEFYIKLEGQNPSGSVKDRVAYSLITNAIAEKTLQKGQTILEATSGNMGIALSFVGALLGYPVEIIMSEAMSIERRKIIQNFGAKLTLTPKETGTTGALEKAQELLQKNPEKYFFVNQFHNPNNPKSYKKLTEELLADIPDFTHFVAGIGTTGTLMGVTKFLKEKNHPAKIIAAVPEKGFKIQGIQNPYEDFRASIFSEENIDTEILVSFAEAKKNVENIGKNIGLLLGGSSGAALTAAQKLDLKKGDKVIILSADRGEKYLSTELFDE